MIDYEQLNAQWREREERLREANDESRQAIFDALTGLGIERIEITFDGYGDSGQIDNVAVTGGSESLSGDVTVTRVPGNGAGEQHTCPLAEAVEDLCYGLLEQEHCGWQDNDGAYGTFVFDVEKRLVSLECHVRYSAIETSLHDFGEA